MLDAPLPQFFIILQGIAGATDVSNFLRAFLMVSLNSLSSGSMKKIPLNFRAFSRCVGQAIVQGDEGPVGGVAQGVQVHGVAGVRHEEEKGGR